jgi:hypothetical protein
MKSFGRNLTKNHELLNGKKLTLIHSFFKTIPPKAHVLKIPTKATIYMDFIS